MLLFAALCCVVLCCSLCSTMAPCTPMWCLHAAVWTCRHQRTRSHPTPSSLHQQVRSGAVHVSASHQILEQGIGRMWLGCTSDSSIGQAAGRVRSGCFLHSDSIQAASTAVASGPLAEQLDSSRQWHCGVVVHAAGLPACITVADSTSRHRPVQEQSIGSRQLSCYLVICFPTAARQLRFQSFRPLTH